MSKLDKKLFEFIKKNPKVRISEQAIRNEISKIRSENPGLTLNAAAVIFAKKRGFKVMKYLTEDDRNTLQSIKVLPSSQIQTKTIKKIKITPATPSFGGEFVTAANENSKVYPYVYILENSLRKLIRDTFSSDTKWWDSYATKDAKDHAIMIQQAEKKHDWLPKRGNHSIYYIGLDDLLGIILKNYPTHFKDIFTDQGNLRTWVNEIVPIRNLLAHNVKISKEEQQNIMIRTKYICTMIENKKSCP